MPIAGISENTFYSSFLSLATFMPPHLAHTKVVGAVHDQDFVPCTSLREVFDLTYESSQLSLSVLTSSAHSNLGLFYSIRWWAEVPCLIKVNAFLVAVSPPAPDDEFIHSLRNYHRMQMPKFRVFLFRPLPFSWVIRMVFIRFFVSELLLYIWADLTDDQVFYVPMSPYIPQHSLYTTFPAVCGRLLESVTAAFENGA